MDIKIDSATGDVVFGVVSTTDIMATTYDSGYGYGYGMAYGQSSAAAAVSSTIRRMGSQFTTTTSENLAQRIKIKLQTFFGEWFLDGTIGVDYFGQIFGKNRSKQSVDAIFQSEILKEREVLQITSFNSTLNQQTRVYSLVFEVKTRDGFYSSASLSV
jgi:hypothetical protein